MTTPLPSAAGLALSIDGWTEALRAKAQLKVTEGVPNPHLAITGGGVRDLLMLDVDFDGLDAIMGDHSVQVGLPYTDVDTALASMGDVPYHSQAGHIEMNLTVDGAISGSFEVTLAEDPEFAVGQPIVFTPSDQVRVLTGQFDGRWELLCQSHLMGHMSLRLGGAFCDALEL